MDSLKTLENRGVSVLDSNSTLNVKSVVLNQSGLSSSTYGVDCIGVGAYGGGIFKTNTSTICNDVPLRVVNTSNTGLFLAPSLGASAYNSMVVAGDVGIMGVENSGASATKGMVLGVWGSGGGGIRVTDTSAYVGGKLYINTNQFRFIPWTSIGTTVGSALTVFNNATGGTGTTAMPAFIPATTCRYYYSVVGNTMYLNYTYSVTGGGGSSGTGKYLYLIPPAFTPDTNVIIPYALYLLTGNYNIPNGSIVGQSFVYAYGSFFATNPVYLISVATSVVSSGYGLGLYYVAQGELNGSNCVSYGTNASAWTVSFQCAISIV